ncbi:MAG: hypothetical protein BA066_06130 [Candidatus Korarchaeota archaeon NZ13-K]|nr:MAG: hypothetical protein BA066_06130 [Candidatus Korarchaeota archaeon NZ13-K]
MMGSGILNRGLALYALTLETSDGEKSKPLTLRSVIVSSNRSGRGNFPFIQLPFNHYLKEPFLKGSHDI